MENYKLKNYYMLETLKREIKQYDFISFDVFDTLLLRDVVYPVDILKILEKEVEQSLGISGFSYIRGNEEDNVRTQSSNEDVTLDEIYSAVESRLKIPCDRIKQREMELESRHVLANPLLKPIFELAIKEGKKVWIISDMYLSSDFLKTLLSQCGFAGFDKIFVSCEIKKAKFTGHLFEHILQTEYIDPHRWLHIGDNAQSDGDMARKNKISAYIFQPLRERYSALKSEKREELQESTGEIFPPEEIEPNTIEYSMQKAEKINSFFTQIEAPSDKIAVQVSNVSMMFNLSAEKVDNLKEYVVKFLKRQLMFQEFWALRDVSFEVRKGEKIGLVGVNGSGKSTMLKIISGVLKPTKGTVEVHGTIAPLIELGAGFDVNLTARENIFLNGAILGYSHKEMETQYDKIIDFSELKEFEDIPIKNYSSGMIARLGFAIATCHVPDILVIDEILSVGDYEFQKKCHKKMKELTGYGATVLFVSHNAEDIIKMCDKVIWLDHGKLLDYGEANYIMDKYINK